MARKKRGRGEGGIGQQGELWYAEVSLGYLENGKRNRKRVYAPSKQEAQILLRELQVQADLGETTKATTITVGQLFDTWLGAFQASWATGTYQCHEKHIRLYLRNELGGVRLAKLTALHVQNHLKTMESKGVSAAMRRHAIVTLRTALEYALRMNLIPKNPSKAVPLPAKSKIQSEGLTPENICEFLAAAAGDRLYALYLVAIDSGCRESELLALTWKDIDFERMTITVSKALEEVNGKLKLKVPKTRSSSRSITLSPTTFQSLQNHRRVMAEEGHSEPGDTVFCGKRHGQWLRKSDLYRLSFKPILTKAKLSCSATTRTPL